MTDPSPEQVARALIIADRVDRCWVTKDGATVAFDTPYGESEVFADQADMLDWITRVETHPH